MDLCDMELERKGIIKSVDVNKDIKRRFMDIGIVPGIEIIRYLEDIGKGISAYMIMDSLIAIRNRDVKGIKVIYEEF